jgi:hypothetical protein
MAVDSHIRKQPSSILHFAICIAIAKKGMHGWIQRDHGKRWPLLTVETEANGPWELWSTNEGGPCLVQLARQASTRDFYMLHRLTELGPGNRFLGSLKV